jgi:hypothetical protein
MKYVLFVFGFDGVFFFFWWDEFNMYEVIASIKMKVNPNSIQSIQNGINRDKHEP